MHKKLEQIRKNPLTTKRDLQLLSDISYFVPIEHMLRKLRLTMKNSIEGAPSSLPIPHGYVYPSLFTDFAMSSLNWMEILEQVD